MKTFRAIIFIFAAALLAASCRGEKLDPDGVQYEFATLRVDGVETRSDSLWFRKGESGKLSIDQLPAAHWTVTDSRTASITSDGILTVKGFGTCGITATSGSTTRHYGLVVPEMNGLHFDIKGADFDLEEIIYNESETVTITTTAVKAYVWNAVLSMEEHFYSYSYWNFTSSWIPKVEAASVSRFVSELNRLTDGNFRLPTKAEWTRYATAAKLNAKAAYTSDGLTGDETEIWLIKD